MDAIMKFEAAMTPSDIPPGSQRTATPAETREQPAESTSLQAESAATTSSPPARGGSPSQEARKNSAISDSALRLDVGPLDELIRLAEELTRKAAEFQEAVTSAKK